MKLTTENIDEFRGGRPCAELALTFQDAFIIARAMGMRYLWIDALCII